MVKKPKVCDGWAAPKLIRQLFPHLIEDGRWGELNINEIATDLNNLLKFELNPFLDPAFLDKWMAFVYKQKGIDYSWGGYLEDRAELWKGHYHKPNETIHVGVDINVPEDTEVLMPTWGKLVHSFQDLDQNGGWGGKIIFECNNGIYSQKDGKGLYLIFGHLKNIPTDVGTKYSPGEKIGTIAGVDCNGGWSPHLHVQLMNKFVPNIDGYVANYDGIEKDYLNPISFVGEWEEEE